MEGTEVPLDWSKAGFPWTAILFRSVNKHLKLTNPGVPVMAQGNESD